MLLLEWFLLAELLVLFFAAVMYLLARKPSEEEAGEHWYRMMRAFWKTFFERRSAFDDAEREAQLVNAPMPGPAPIIPAPREASVTMPVIVVPESTCDQVVGFEGDAIKMLVSTPVSSGQTNKAVMQLLVEVLQLRPHQVQLLRGHYSERKLVQINGLDKAAVERKLASFL